ncbi:MAG: hypothetical protein ACYC05_06865 [Sulfuricella sp.]|nr:hypothetical protein [Gammaproteobacteria bacterium]
MEISGRGGIDPEQPVMACFPNVRSTVKATMQFKLSDPMMFASIVDMKKLAHNAKRIGEGSVSTFSLITRRTEIEIYVE